MNEFKNKALDVLVHSTMWTISSIGILVVAGLYCMLFWAVFQLLEESFGMGIVPTILLEAVGCFLFWLAGTHEGLPDDGPCGE